MTLLLRPATPADADTVATIFTASRKLLTFLPALHTADEDRGFIRDHVFASYRITVAEQDGSIAGYLAESPGWIEQLYLAPDRLRAGIGSALLRDAQARHPALELWCFVDNHRARAFYERNGFIESFRTDGSALAEKCPDIRYRWER